MNIPPRLHILVLALLSLPFIASADTPGPIMIDGNDKGRIFDGIGGLSAGASSRLLIDYPEPQRSEILDYLFKPNFGAALQINKVEIGGDMNSTDGSEPSHMRTRDDENYQRGYEWWLMEESRKRNPDVKLYGLEWGAPGWVNPKVNNVWTDDNITYILNWVRHAKSDHNLVIDYLGGWNEKGCSPPWFKKFRQALNQAGFHDLKVVAADGWISWAVGSLCVKDPQFAASFEIIGTHYPKLMPKKDQAWQDSLHTGKPLWGSETGNSAYNTAPNGLAKLYNQGYIGSRMVAYINWSTIWSVLPSLPFHGFGLMLADSPWSGHYEVDKSIWATAHTTQFAQPGWQYLDGACGYMGGDSKNGSYVALRSPDHKDYSVIVETTDAKASQSVAFAVTGGLSTSVLHVWRTDLSSKKNADWFIRQPDITPAGGKFTVQCDKGCVYSFTTTSGQAKGETTSPPAAMLPLPYRDDFQSYAIGRTPKYFSDQNGTFEVAPAGAGRTGKCLRQMVAAKPVWWDSDADPATLVGDPLWKNYRVSSDVLLEQPGYVELNGRMMGAHRPNLAIGYHLRLSDTGHWSLRVAYNPKTDADPVREKELSSGDMPAAAGINKWHTLCLTFSGSNISAKIDGTPAGSGVVDTTYGAGLVGYQANGWQTAEFMNFEVAPADR